MLKNEFEDYVGFKVSDEEFNQIERQYKSCGNADKYLFCKKWLEALNGAEYKARLENSFNKKIPPLPKGTLTTKKLMEDVFARVKEMPEYKRIEPIIEYIDYFDGISKFYEITKYYFDFHAAINYPCNEGIFIDCWLQGEFDNFERDCKFRIGNVKTLKDDKEAFKMIGELTGLLTLTAYEYMNEQIDRGYFEKMEETDE